MIKILKTHRSRSNHRRPAKLSTHFPETPLDGSSLGHMPRRKQTADKLEVKEVLGEQVKIFAEMVKSKKKKNSLVEATMLALIYSGYHICLMVSTIY